MRQKTYLLALSSLPFLISACSGGAADLRENLGIDKEIPDEFAVVTQAPLEMPSSLTLPPPRPGQARPQATSAQVQAQQAVFGQALKTQTELSSAENAVLAKAGANQAPDDIRTIVDQETEELKKTNLSAVQKLMNWDATQVSVIDAKKEMDRIRQTQQNGQPITTGETPILSDDE